MLLSVGRIGRGPTADAKRTAVHNVTCTRIRHTYTQYLCTTTSLSTDNAYDGDSV